MSFICTKASGEKHVIDFAWSSLIRVLVSSNHEGFKNIAINLNCRGKYCKISNSIEIVESAGNPQGAFIIFAGDYSKI
jgi:hypothetical protein